MNRYAIFAHYDADNKIEDYVLYYLKELKNVCDYIVFVSDSNLAENETEKISGFVNEKIIGRHGEYDFGSYKRGYTSVKAKLKEGDELVFANDSCFAPFVPFNEIFNEMQSSNGDAWGMIFSNKKKEFLMSFFLVFKSQVFKSEYFDDFICGISKEKSKDIVILENEINLSITIKNNGHSLDSYLKNEDIEQSNKTHLKSFLKKLSRPKLVALFIRNHMRNNTYDDNNFYLIYKKFPFIKKLAFTEGDGIIKYFYKEAINGNYPTNLIDKYLKSKNIKQEISRTKLFCIYLKKFFKPFKSLSIMPIKISKTATRNKSRTQIKIYIFGLRLLSFKIYSKK